MVDEYRCKEGGEKTPNFHQELAMRLSIPNKIPQIPARNFWSHPTRTQLADYKVSLRVHGFFAASRGNVHPICVQDFLWYEGKLSSV